MKEKRVNEAAKRRTAKAQPSRASAIGYTAKDVFYEVRVNKPGHKWHGCIVGLLTNGGVVAQVLRDGATEFLKWREVVAVEMHKRLQQRPEPIETMGATKNQNATTRPKAQRRMVRSSNRMLTSNQITIAAKMFELRDTMKRLYAERWPTVAAPAMEGSGDTNPLSAVIPLAKDMDAKGHNPTLLMAVAVEMADS